MKRGTQHHDRPSMTTLDPETTARVVRFVFEHGRRDSTKLLGVGDATLEAAKAGGRMRVGTAERLREAVRRTGASLSEGSAEKRVSLQVDEEYQRDLRDDKATKIASEFSWPAEK